MIFASPHSFIDKDRAIGLGAQYMNFIWKVIPGSAEISARRQADVWIVVATGPKDEKDKSEDLIWEPVTILIDANNGHLCGGAFTGEGTAIHNLGHQISTATTKSGLDVSSLFQRHCWEDIIASAKPTQRHRTFPFLKIHELLGGDAEVNTDGSLTINHKALRPASKYRKFLRSLAHFSRESHFPAVKVIPRMK